MAADVELAQRICDLLNDMLARDRPAVAAMVANRISCRAALADHPTVQVAAQHGGFHVGLLGVLNGLCGLHAGGIGPICAVFDGPDEATLKDLMTFRLTKPEDFDLEKFD